MKQETLEEIKALPFVKKATLGIEGLAVTYKPTILPINKFTKCDHGKNFGKRFLYLGTQKLRLYVNYRGDICSMVTGDIRHPHTDSEGAMCFGYGAGGITLRALKNEKKYKEFVSMVWMWLHVYDSGNPHRNHKKVYDNCLTRGFPVWDAKGKRIKINEKLRILTGEQRKLKKCKEYVKTVKKFEKVKLK